MPPSAWHSRPCLVRTRGAAHRIFPPCFPLAVNLIQLIRAYQVAGHTAARVDPLNLASRPTPEILNPKFYGFNEQDLDREIRVNVEHLKGFLGATRPRVTLVSVGVARWPTHAHSATVGDGGGFAPLLGAIARLDCWSSARALL